MAELRDQQIISSWQKNALPWTRAVRERQIESRELVTDQAIIDAVMAGAPRQVLDLGCGEGWLSRELARHGVEVTGVDVIAELVVRAQQAGGGEFRLLSYEEIATGGLPQTFDAVACNFSLLGKESVERLFAVIPSLLTAHGRFVMQTLHPVTSCSEHPYQDGWREGTWHGFSAEFTDPPPWYFRTLEGWSRLFNAHGLRLQELREPIHPRTRQPASIVFVAQAV